MADVATELHALKGDLRELGVGLVEGDLQIGRYRGDGEDAAAGSDELAVFDRGAGVEDDYVFARRVSRWEASDGFARGVFARVASAGRDDADAGTRAHPDGELVGGTVDGGVEEVDDIGFETEEDGFGFGVAEASVELEDHGAARGHHDAAEEDALERLALGAHAVDGLLRDVAEKPLAHGGSGDAVGRISAHAAGVGTGVAFADTLMVLGGGYFNRASPVAEGEEGELFTGEELFEDNFGFGGAEKRATKHLGGGFFCLKVCVADDYAFAGGETGGFDDDWDGEAGEFFVDLVEGGADGVGGGGDALTLHELFSEGLAGLEHCCGLRGAKDAMALPGELVDDADGEGELGADDGEGRLLDGD